MHYLFFIVSLLCSLHVHSSETQNRIIENLKPNSITVIGEYHKKPESIQFFQELIYRYVKQGKCLVVALEIASSQQQILDDIVTGKAASSSIKIAPMIDHPPFRTLLDDLSRMKGEGYCLRLVAIDAELVLGVDRDEWMAKKLSDYVGQIPILALLGNLHTLKKVDWNMPMSKISPYVSEILVSLGYSIKAYPQIWRDEICTAYNRFVTSDSKETVKLINNKLVSLLNASEYKQVNDAVDDVILWGCSETAQRK